MAAFTLCYRNFKNLSWTCECDIPTVIEVDQRAQELKQQNENIWTTFFPTYTWTPQLFKKLYAKYMLTPDVQMICDKNSLSYNPTLLIFHKKQFT